MEDKENKHDLLMKRAQVLIAILVGVVTLLVGVYNAKNTIFAKKGQGAVSVLVQSSKRQPVAGASVELLNSQNARISMAQTDLDGKFEKEKLEAGNYSLKISKSGFETEITTIAVDPGRTTDFSLILRANGSPMQSAIEEVGASWIKTVGTPKSKTEEKGTTP